MIGTILGNRYEIIEKIGEGGMADVYKAKCQKLNRYDAVKILKKEFINDNTLVEKFTKEATAIANLSDNNIVNVLDVGTQGDIHYIVMEYVNGKTLKQIIREEGKLSYEKVLDYGIQIAKALDCAHRNNIIHRDVKPQNILVTNDGVVKVTDFGIAKSPNSETITNTSRVMGSAHYFSPEQAKGNYVDYRSDIYSFGVVLYEMITGRLPFDAESPVSVALKHIQEPVVPPIIIDEKIPESLNKLILKAMEKEPIKRYQSVKEILNDLLKIQKNAEVNIVSNDIDEDFTRVMKPITEKDLKNEENKKKLAAKKDEDDDEEDEDDYYEEDDEDRKSKKKKYLIFSLVGVLVIALGVIVAALVLKPSEKNKSEEIVVPKIIGLSQEEAKKVLESKGLKMVIGGSEPSDEPEGTVIKVYPGEGEKAQEKVRVTISGGANKLTAPDLKDLDKSKAEEYLKNAGLVLGAISYDYSDDVTKGNVIRQNPTPDTEVKKGDKVDIVLSNGPKIKLIKVPSVLEMTRANAERTLKANKLEMVIADETRKTTDKNKDGKVAFQNPNPDIEVKEGSVITVTLYKYEEEKVMVSIPSDIRGIAIKIARQRLKELGLNLEKGSFNDDDIIKSLDRNGEVPKGSTINVTEVEQKKPDKPTKPGEGNGNQ